MARTIEIAPEDKVYVRSDLFPAGRTEEGHVHEAYCLYVIVERLDGHRLRHFESFSCDKFVEEYDEKYGEISRWVCIREQAEAEVGRLVSNIEAAGVLNMDYWEEVDPRYGSEYYCIKHDC